jgi:hypothetical protein
MNLVRGSGGSGGVAGNGRVKVRRKRCQLR